MTRQAAEGRTATAGTVGGRKANATTIGPGGGPGYAFGGKRAQMIHARLAYIKRYGARFLFNNQPPPFPGWPRQYREPAT